jgi:D-alanyl-D-alanine carboxypeptidase
VPTVTFEDYVDFRGAAYIAIDAKTGQTLHSYNDTVSWSPASLSKLLTALIAVEQFELDDTCEASLDTLRWNDVIYKNAAVQGLDPAMVTYASYVKGKIGKDYTAEQWMNATYSVKDRLYQMLMASCADAAEAIAYKIEENLDFFVEQIMKDKIDELRLTGTVLNNAVGADGSCNEKFKDNVTTARDLAVIAKAVMEDKTLREIVSTQVYTMHAAGDIPAVVLENSNLLLTDSAFRSENFTCIGIKTGYTSEAGYCLAACGRDVDGNEVIVIALGNDYKKESYTQTMKMLDYIFKYEK